METRRVLVIEDDADLASLIGLVLSGDGYQCQIATTLAKGRQLLATEAFQFLLLDLILPDGNGMEILPTLAGSQNANATVIVSSGNVSPSTLLDPRIKGFFEKPYDLKDLLGFMKATG